MKGFGALTSGSEVVRRDIDNDRWRADERDGHPMAWMAGWWMPVKRKMNFARCSIVGLSSIAGNDEKTIAMTDAKQRH